MNLEIAVLKRKRTWSGLSVLTGLCRLLAFPSRLWGRFWPARTTPGGTHSRLGELPKSLFQFRKGWTNSKPVFNFPGKVSILPFQNFSVSKANDPPPKFFQCNRTYQVFATLRFGKMRCPVHFDHNLTPWKGKVRYSFQTGEWVLGTVRLSKFTYEVLKSDLGSRGLHVEVEPVTKERQRPIPEVG